MTIPSRPDALSSPDPVASDNACPRCGRGFHCGVNDGHCACFGLRLSEPLKAAISARYPGQCLCVACLAALAAAERAGDRLTDQLVEPVAKPPINLPGSPLWTR